MHALEICTLRQILIDSTYIDAFSLFLVVPLAGCKQSKRSL